MASTLVVLELDRGACIGYGECVAEDPDAIELDASGTARLLVEHLDAGRAKRLCDVCPTGALKVRR